MTIPTKPSTRSEGIKRANVSPEQIFRRGLALAEFREDVTVEVPLSLFNEDGSLRKTNKSDLALYLESLADMSDMDETTTSNVIYIRDGMAVGWTIFPIMELPPKEHNSDYELVQYTIYLTVRTRLQAHKVSASSIIFYSLSDRR